MTSASSVRNGPMLATRGGRLTDRAVQDGNPSEFKISVPAHRGGPSMVHASGVRNDELILSQNTRITSLFGCSFP